MATAPAKGKFPTFEEWLTSHMLKPFSTNEENFDMGLIDGLMTNIASGYDMSKPLVKAESEDSDIDNRLLDGWHRSYSMYNLEKKGIMKFKQLPVVTEVIKNKDEFNARRMHYILLNQSKDKKTSEKQMEGLMRETLERHPEYVNDKNGEFFVKLEQWGFPNKMAAVKCYKKIIKNDVGSQERSSDRKHEPLSEEEEQQRQEIKANWKNPNAGFSAREFQCKNCKTIHEIFIKENGIVGSKILKEGKRVVSS